MTVCVRHSVILTSEIAHDQIQNIAILLDKLFNAVIEIIAIERFLHRCPGMNIICSCIEYRISAV